MRFSPGIYEHAAALIGRTPQEVSRDATLLAEAHAAAWARYRHPLVVTGIDVYNLEPEAYGAVLGAPNGNEVPSITSRPCAEIEDLAGLPPLEPLAHARTRSVLAAGEALTKRCPGAEVRIPVCGPFALGIGLVGLDALLMATVEDPEGLNAALEHLLAGQINYLRAIHAAGLRPIFFESGTCPPLLPAQSFVRIEAPLLKRLFAVSHELFGEAPPCVVGGDAAPIAKHLFEAGPGWVIAPSETDQTAFMETAQAYPEIHVRVNLPATLLLEKDPLALEAGARRTIDLARRHPNTSVGCGVVPFETRPETILHLQTIIES